MTQPSTSPTGAAPKPAKADRWKQIKELVAAAQNIDRAGRAAFVRAQCGADDELRREVLSLLSSDEKAGSFLESPAVVFNPAVRDQDTETGAGLAGARLGAYEVVREIGRGGMGAVYLAVRADNEFRKQVAIKLIRGGMENDFSIRRFRNERQILARLEHPNIARLIDGGTSSTGHPYFVMEFVEGQGILAHCESRKRSICERVEIFLKACAAVQYAHRRMIIHRDIKPGNILVMEDGTPKLLDFGIAKLLDPESTDPGADPTLAGFRMITPAYASPEQIRGEQATVRSDIYSLGVVLWEILTGHRIGRDRSLELPDTGYDDTTLLHNLRNVVLKATRANPGDRYDSVDALTVDLEKALAGNEIASIAVAGAPVAEPPQPGSIAVLPFQLLSTDSTSESYLGVGIADAIITRLSNIGRISVRPTGAVMKFASGVSALEAGRELNVRFVLEGRVRKSGNRVRVTVQLVEVHTNGPVWAGSFDDNFEDLLNMEDSISAQVAEALVPQMSGEEREYLAVRGTSNPKAHQAYLRGRWYWNKHTEDAMPQALVHFSEAISEDPRYARAHAGIADYYIGLGVRGILCPMESFAAAIQAARTAIELDPKLAEAHASLGHALWAHEQDYEMASHHLQLAIALNPDYAVAHDWMGLMNLSRGRTAMAIVCIERARKLDPRSTIFAADMALCHYLAGAYQEAIDCFSRSPYVGRKARGQDEGTETLESPAVINSTILPLSLLATGQNERALEAARRLADATSGSALSLGILARAEALNGNAEQARSLLDELTARSRDYYVSGTALALANLACNRNVEAIAQLERAFEERDWCRLWLPMIPAWEELRQHPRFQRLLELSHGRLSRETLGETALRVPHRGGNSASRMARSAAVAVIGLLAIAAALVIGKFRVAPTPFQNVRISKLTTNGLAEKAAIAPNGRYVAYTLRAKGSASIWVQKIEDGAPYQVAGPFEGLVASLHFTRNGEHIVFVTEPLNDPLRGVLYIVPASGGPPTLTVSGVPFSLGLSPDESHFAYFRTDAARGADELIVAEIPSDLAKPRRERVLGSRPHPQAFVKPAGPVWSVDGKKIAYAVTGGATGARLEVIDLNGSVRELKGTPWQSIVAIAWAKDSRGLLVSGRDRDGAFQQIWYVPLGAGSVARVTNDLTTYNAVSVTSDASALVSVEARAITNLYMLPAGEFARAVQITQGGGRYFDVNWTPDGSLVYASDATGSSEIWSMDAAGKRQRQLTNGLGQSHDPAVAPDGQSIAFGSNRGGVWNIWRMNLDGGNPSAVTHDASDSANPAFTPDGGSIVYQHFGPDALQTIWKTPVVGGAAVQLTHLLSVYPATAPDGRMAAWFTDNPATPNWKIGIWEPGHEAPRHVIKFPGNRMPSTLLRWVPGRNAISYIESRDGASNIWIAPLDGSAPKQLTSFTSDRIYSFDWSRDGRVVYSQGMSTMDVVLMQDSKKVASGSR